MHSKLIATFAFALLAASCGTVCGAHPEPVTPPEQAAIASNLPLGNFSVSLAVKDIAASRKFYEALGFIKVGGNMAENWVVLRNGQTKIGLFQGMFEGNLMTFNPGWDSQGEALANFKDVRDIQAELEAAGLTLTMRADPELTGPASLTLVDPDGNVILIDQHVPRGK